MTTGTPTPEGFAAEVLTALKDDERNIQWLSRQTGIASSTLRSQLLKRPASITLRNALRISAVIPVTPFERVAA